MSQFARLGRAKKHLRSISIALLPHAEQVKVERALTELDGLDDDMVMAFRAAEQVRIDAVRVEVQHKQFVDEMIARFGIAPTTRENVA